MADWTTEIDIPIEVSIQHEMGKFTVLNVWLVSDAHQQRIDVTKFLPDWTFDEFLACAEVDNKFGNWKPGLPWKDTWAFEVTVTCDYDQADGLENVQAWLEDRRSPDIVKFIPQKALEDAIRIIEEMLHEDVGIDYDHYHSIPKPEID